MGFGVQNQSGQTGGKVASNQSAAPQNPIGAQSPQGKGGGMSQNGNITTPSASGQPQMGMPNQYSNTVGQWDNAPQITMPSQNVGKGKG